MNKMVLTLANFEREVQNSAYPVLVDFWASWCGYCKMLEPVLDEVLADWAAEGTPVRLATVNVDEEPQIAAAYGVDSLPTVVLFRDGKEAARQIGFAPKNVIKKLL